MKKIILAISVCVCLISMSFAQTPDTLDCDVPDRDITESESLPWFGNNDYLENFLDSIGYPQSSSGNRIIGPNQAKYHVPIKFWVYRNSAGIGGPNQQQLQIYINSLNRFYNTDNNTLIGFYMKCDIGFIDDDDHVVINNDPEALNQVQNNKEKGCINIHITDELQGTTLGVQYRSRFFGIDGIFLSRLTYTDNNFVSVIAHEVGHYFELDHTHQYANSDICKREAINRNRLWGGHASTCPFGSAFSNVRVCETTGDFLRDTPADHDLSFNESCDYIITGQTDSWGINMKLLLRVLFLLIPETC